MFIKPFSGIRPDVKYVNAVNSPPYDVISREEVRKIINSNPFSFLRITRADGELPESIDEHSEEVYRKARENFEEFFKKGILFKEKAPCFYLLSQTWKGRTQIGIYAAVRCEDYEQGLIKRHELTRKEKEEDRTRHIYTVKAGTGPVFLTFEDNKDFNYIVKDWIKQPPLYTFLDEKSVENNLWIINKNTEFIIDYFKKIPSFYIADGHHRAAAAVNVWKKIRQEKKGYSGPADYFMSVIFPASHLQILPYNRIVLDLNNISREDFLSLVKKRFTVKPSRSLAPEKKGEFGMCLNGEIYRLSLLPEVGNSKDVLDADILQRYLLSPILGIDDPRSSNRIQFIGGIKPAEELVQIVKEGKAKISFALFPVSIRDVMEVADRGEIMPPKSTWFEPKLRDGLVVYSIEQDSY